MYILPCVHPLTLLHPFLPSRQKHTNSPTCFTTIEYVVGDAILPCSAAIPEFGVTTHTSILPMAPGSPLRATYWASLSDSEIFTNTATPLVAVIGRARQGDRWFSTKIPFYLMKNGNDMKVLNACVFECKCEWVRWWCKVVVRDGKRGGAVMGRVGVGGKEMGLGVLFPEVEFWFDLISELLLNLPLPRSEFKLYEKWTEF